MALLKLPFRLHFYGSAAIALIVSMAISSQMTDRRGFANSELYEDVMDRWGAPIQQSAPSVRYVTSGAVFNSLESMPFQSQDVRLDATMNYRKRGLNYYSGFDFQFSGKYRVTNTEGRPLDLVFVFPIDLQRSKVLLSNLAFTVNGESAPIDLGPTADKLTWTGRLEPDQELELTIAFDGRGLDSFGYILDPNLPVRDFRLVMNVSGGDTFDYAPGVVPATSIGGKEDQVSLEWNYPSLESGVPVGIILPAEKSFDHLVATMIRRAWFTFIAFFAGIIAIATYYGRRLTIYETYLVSAAYAFFFVLLAYLAAFMSFYLAYIIAGATMGGIIVFYIRRVISPLVTAPLMGLVASTLFMPTIAVILEGYTGLIYSFEILGAIVLAMVLTTRHGFRVFLENFVAETNVEEVSDAI